MKKLYIAIPYSKVDKDRSFEIANQVAAYYIRQGCCVYSPITDGHVLKRYGLPDDWEFWGNFDREFIQWCDEIVVCMVKGWEQSTGVNAEIEFARQLGKSIHYVTPGKIIEILGSNNGC